MEDRLKQALTAMENSGEFMEKMEMGSRFLKQCLGFAQAASEVRNSVDAILTSSDQSKGQRSCKSHCVHCSGHVRRGQSDLAHRSALTIVFNTDRGHHPFCLHEAPHSRA